MMRDSNLVVIGGGILGLATASTIAKSNPRQHIVVLEKEDALAKHQTGRNSGVVHAGLYYKPNSLKAKLCRRGKALLERYADERGVPFERCGKLVVATTEVERERLHKLNERAQANGVKGRLIGAEEAREIEPHAKVVEALHVPETGIIDFVSICDELAKDLLAYGGEIRLGTRVLAITQNNGATVVETNAGPIPAEFVINCGGLQADRIARMTGATLDARIIPFRGDYYKLKPHARHLCKGLIYPVPDPAFPFLGVHFTRMIGGEVECGPNAVLSLAREGYGRASFNLRDALSAATWPGLHRLIAKHWRMGLGELLRSWSKQRFTRSLQRLVPEITSSDIETATAGNRAQALAKDGGLVDDFLIEHIGSCTHVINAPSPAATASLAIAEKIVAEVGITSKPTSMLMEHSE